MSKTRKVEALPTEKLVIVAVIAALVAFGVVFAISKSHVAKITSSNSVCPQKVTCVALNKDKAIPDVITIPVGDYAQFNSADGQLHNLGLGGGDVHHDGSHVHTGTYVSGDFKGDEAWKVQFNQAGTFDLHDHYRPELHMSVVVYQPGGDYKIKN